MYWLVTAGLRLIMPLSLPGPKVAISGSTTGTFSSVQLQFVAHHLLYSIIINSKFNYDVQSRCTRVVNRSKKRELNGKAYVPKVPRVN